MSFADKIEKLVKSAPVATAGGNNVNFGPTTFTPIIVRWKGKGQKPDKFTLPEYVKENGLDDVDDIELTPGKESFQLHIDIDVSALNPSLNFHVERDVSVTESNKTSKDPKKHILTSWSEIVEPSLVAVFGDEWYKKIVPNGKKDTPVFFTAAENVDPVEPVKDAEAKVYQMPKFIAVYKTLDECRTARDKRYPSRDDAEAVAFGPDDETEEEEGSFPEEVLEQVRDLYKSTRKNKKQTMTMLKSNPFGDAKHKYDAEELYAAAIEE